VNKEIRIAKNKRTFRSPKKEDLIHPENLGIILSRDRSMFMVTQNNKEALDLKSLLLYLEKN